MKILKKRAKKSIFFVYNSFKDPLFQSNLFKYLISYQESNLDIKVTLITFENKEYSLKPKEEKVIHNQLRRLNIAWIPKRFRYGKFKTIKKIIQLFGVLLFAFYLRLKGYGYIVSLGTVSGIYAMLLGEIFGFKHFCYQFEPHFQFLAEFDSRISFLNKYMTRLEATIPQTAYCIATGTNHMLKKLSTVNLDKPAYLVPSCVDEDNFIYNKDFRRNTRKRLGIEGKRVLLYAGKFGGLYYDDDFFLLTKKLIRIDPNIYILIINTHDHEHIKTQLKYYGFQNKEYHLTSSLFQDMPKWLSVGDIGIVSIPPLPSQRYRSPIKVGEYLCCGLPYIVCQGISEDDIYANKFNVGITISSFSINDAEFLVRDIDKLLESEPKETLNERCRKIGIKYRGFKRLNSIMHRAFNDFYNS